MKIKNLLCEKYVKNMRVKVKKNLMKMKLKNKIVEKRR